MENVARLAVVKTVALGIYAILIITEQTTESDYFMQARGSGLGPPSGATFSLPLCSSSNRCSRPRFGRLILFHICYIEQLLTNNF